MSLKERLGLGKKPYTGEIVGVRPEVLSSVEEKSPENLWPVGVHPLQQIPEQDLQSFFKPKKPRHTHQETRGAVYPQQQIPEEDIRRLLEGRRTPREKKQASPKVGEVKTPPAVEPPKKSRFSGILGWNKKEQPKPPVVQPATVVSTPIAEQKPPEPPLEPKGREFVPDPPPQKGKKGKVIDIIKEKKKQSAPKPVKKLTYEEAVEEYERQLAAGKKPQGIAANKKVDSPNSNLARFSAAEVRKLLIIQVMPSRIRSYLAKRSRVNFTIMCGIYQYEFIKLVTNRAEGIQVMKDLRDALNYDSILETYKKRSGEVLAVYSRARTEQRGRYSGTPLHPRLEEKY